MNFKLLASLFVLVDPLQAANLLKGGDLSALVKATSYGLFSNDKSKGYSFHQPPQGAFPSMGALKTEKAYEIKIFKNRDKMDTRSIFFSSPDLFELKGREKFRLIQASTESKTYKNLCILTTTKSEGVKRNDIKEFVKEITSAKTDEDRDSVFAKHFKRIGLSGIGFKLSYNIYAWETNYDCGLYNVGMPENLSQAKTEVFSHFYTSKTYAIQVSLSNMEHEPLSIFQVKTDAKGPESLRVQPFRSNYSSVSRFFDEFKPSAVSTLEISGQCAAIFSQTNTDTTETAANFITFLGLYKNQGINNFRIQTFHDEADFKELLKCFPGSHTVTFAMWEKRNGTCNFSRDSESRNTSVDSNDSSHTVSLEMPVTRTYSYASNSDSNSFDSDDEYGEDEQYFVVNSSLNDLNEEEEGETDDELEQYGEGPRGKYDEIDSDDEQ